MVTRWENEYGFGRPLGAYEVVMNAIHHKQMWILARALVVSCETKPYLGQIDQALRYLMKWNPSLRMAIKRQEDGSSLFCEQTEAKPRLQCFYNETDWQKILEDQMTIPMEDSEAPQFRCIYLPHAEYDRAEGENNVCVFIFTINHTIIDGMSTMATQRAFVEILNDVVSGREPTIEPWKKMHPPSEHFVMKQFARLPEEVQQEIQNVPKKTLQDFMNPESCLYTERRGIEAQKDPTLPYKTCITIRDFGAEEVNKLRAACRANGTTIQAAAQIAGCVALATILQNSSEWEPLEIRYDLAMNLRPHLAHEVSVNYTGLYVSMLFDLKTKIEKEIKDPDTKKATFWKLAKASTTEMKAMINDKKYIGFEMMLMHMNPSDMEQLDTRGHKFNSRQQDILYTTSYGAWEFPSKGDAKIKPVMVYTNSSIHHVGAIFSQQLITINGRMSWAAGWSARVVSRETAQRFADVMWNLLHEVVQDD